VSDEKRDDQGEKTEPVAEGETAAAEVATTTDGETASVSEPPTDEAEAEAGADAEEDDGGIDAIARRAAAIGGGDELDRVALEEERKLAERRAQRKGKGKKGGLETAASRKLSKIGERAAPRRTVAVAADADPLIERTAKLSDWAKKNQTLVQIVGGLLAVALIGVAGFLYFQHKKETDASVLLAQAVADERGRIHESKDDDDEQAFGGLPTFPTFEARRESALAKYREVVAKYPGTGAAILARLAEGSLLLDMKKPDEAAAAFSDVKGSPLAAADVEVRGRAIEGIGFAHEQKARAVPAEADKHYEQALGAYRELENDVDVRGFKELAMYHQARVLEDKGDKDKAKEILISLRDRLKKPEDSSGVAGAPQGPSFPYLREVAMDRLRELDPEAAPRDTGGTPGGDTQLSPAQIRKMIEEAQKKGAAGGDDDGHGH
jgi:predicted negative regulator of RcsB-dependent stress response